MDELVTVNVRMADFERCNADLDRLEAENSKLRELVLDLCDAIDSVFWDGEVETRERFEPRMSELGIEVTNG